jgi:hypothetical protein
MTEYSENEVLWEHLSQEQQREYLSIQRAEGEPGYRCNVHFDGWVCTRPPGHMGPHFAGSHRSPQHCHIYAIWDELPDDMRMDIGL